MEVNEILNGFDSSNAYQEKRAAFLTEVDPPLVDKAAPTIILCAFCVSAREFSSHIADVSLPPEEDPLQVDTINY